MGIEGTSERERMGDARFWALAGLVCLAFLAMWLATTGASLTHDEAVYADIATHPFSSSFYPGDIFLRHPPLGLGLLAGWMTLELPLRAWPLAWSLGGLLVLADAIRQRDGSPAWLIPPALAAPVAIPLLTVTLYPPLFFFLALAAWAWACQRRDVEIVSWNLAVFTHELALLLLAFLLAARAASYVREGVRDGSRWARLVWPYPAAVVWGSVMVFTLLRSTDARGGYLASIVDPSPNIAAILGLKPWVGLIILLTVLPLLVDPRRDDTTRVAGLVAASIAAILTAPFYRYALPLVPPLAVLCAGRPPAWFQRVGPIPILVAAVFVSGLAVGATVSGADTLNAANIPGLVDHEEAASLIGPGEHVVVRSSPSFAWTLADGGWRITQTAATGPAIIVLERGNERIVLHRAETFQRLHEVDEVDAVVFPSTWRNVPDRLPGDGWSKAGEAGGATRWEPG